MTDEPKEPSKINYSLATARGQIRIIPGLAKLHIWGGEGERDSNEEDQNDDQDDTDQNDNPDDNEDADESGDKDDAKDKGKSLEEQLDDEKRARAKLERQIARDKKAAEDAEADKDVVKDRDRYKAKVEARDKFLTENLLQIEVLKQTKYSFVDVEDVVTALQRDEDVHVDLDADTPNVEGLDIALKRLAKKKPHWLKKDDDDEDEKPPSGSRAGSGKLDSEESEDRRLGEKFKIPGYGTQGFRPV
jgi:hypothetical protein